MKRKHHEDHVNHEAWAIPYADLMTLLLAFFVVMYAVSVVNEGKYRVMSESIIEAFNGSSHVIAPMPPQKARPHNVDPAIAAPQSQPGAAAAPVAVPIPLRPASRRMDAVRATHETMRDVQAAAEARRQANLTRIQHEVERALQPLIDKQQVIVRRTPNWLEIEIRTDILFPSGVAQLSRPAGAVLGSLAGILAPFGNPLRIEGYTDDKPINTAVYPSNWELSAARAASVARLFAEHGISPARLGIIGWGQFRPAADNATAEGRNRNRRVLVVVLSDHAMPVRYSGDADRAGQLADSASPTDASDTSVAGTHAAGLANARPQVASAQHVAAKAPAHVTEPTLVVTPERGK
ncbi:flagellar motor protein MotD [Frateuria terrea]|uniref:Chemotaxis protein MotB n=1 Tax=Frateuria terrea TaxID=529704 RepID=A0A1H6VW73_9GAMM|nr:flagellar motor protein MotD [Frateuria terrea]SEJ08889.1 chemotaxis protein MotB [Frateuria terrea]SFP68723.1 chemotaxis protein MotB [Frateuria terrea]